MLTHRSFLLSLPGPTQILHKREKMHLKVLFSFHFPLRLKSLVFLHFSFIPRLACAESDYNTLNLQKHKALQSALWGLHTCVLLLFPAIITAIPGSAPACRSHSDTQPRLPSLQKEFRMGFACTSPLLLCAEAREMPCPQGCPALLFQA